MIKSTQYQGNNNSDGATITVNVFSTRSPLTILRLLAETIAIVAASLSKIDNFVYRNLRYFQSSAAMMNLFLRTRSRPIKILDVFKRDVFCFWILFHRAKHHSCLVRADIRVAAHPECQK